MNAINSRWIGPLLMMTLVVAALATATLFIAWPVDAADAALGPAADPDALKWGFVAAAASAGLAALGAGYAVAHVGTAALGALAEKPDLFGRVLVMVGLAEGIAIYGLIVSILILNRLD
jgi:V/A-type H+-transporting ATPase subunit K